MHAEHVVICRTEPPGGNLANRCWTRAVWMNGELLWDWRDLAANTFGVIWGSVWDDMKATARQQPKPTSLTVTNRTFTDVARDADAIAQSPHGYGSIICPVGDETREWAVIGAPEMEVLARQEVTSTMGAVMLHQITVGLEPDNSAVPYVKGFLIRPTWCAVDLVPSLMQPTAQPVDAPKVKRSAKAGLSDTGKGEAPKAA